MIVTKKNTKLNRIMCRIINTKWPPWRAVDMKSRHEETISLTRRGFCHKNMSPKTRYGIRTDHFCEFWAKSCQQFDL
jgi:hypothetical protein